MEDKLEPNMYVRLNCNYALGIGKTIGEIDEDNFIKTKFKNDFECSLPTYMITKASHNIIDLIEVGDYVNGYPVYETIDYPDNTRAIVIADDNKSIIWEESSQYIKSILTREQYESMKYEVK